MKRTLMASLACLAIATGGAEAADMPMKAPPAAAPPTWSWTGCYLGANGGGGWSHIDVTRIVTPSGVPVNDNYGSADGSGWVGGGQIGCDYQMGQFVFGIQGMFDAVNIKTDHTIPTAFAPPETTFSYHTDIRSISSVTGRVGVTVTPAMLLYVKGGGAWKREDLSVFGDVPFQFLSETASVTFKGGTVGGGFEYGFAPNWSLFVEANYFDFGTTTVTFIAAPGTTNAGQVGDTMNQRERIFDVIGGINFRFNWSSPVVAKY
jgi:outer membrane immunogenic protein